jgi:hypothetical protein
MSAYRHHFPLRFRAFHAAEAFWVNVRRLHPDARLVNLRETADGWAACLSTRVPLRFRRLATDEGKRGGRCVCSR